MGFEGFLGHQIDRHPQQLGKALFKAHEPHKTNGPLEFDKDVDITASSLLSAMIRMMWSIEFIESIPKSNA